MQTTNDFLDAVKSKHGLTSDYQLAKFLNFRQQRISIYRHHGAFDDDACITVAQALSLEPSYVMACIAAERTKSEKAKAVWSKLAKRLSAVAAVVLVISLAPALILSTGITPAPLQTLADAGMSLSAYSQECALCEIMHVIKMCS